MTIFQVHSIPSGIAEEVRKTMRAPGYGHPAYREAAALGTGPCRQCLRTFEVGVESRILFTYQPFTEDGSLPAPGPIFIHASACERYEGATLPPDLRSLPLVFEAYANGGHLLAQERVEAGASDDQVRAVIERTGADYVHIRHGEAGCFIARVSC